MKRFFLFLCLASACCYTLADVSDDLDSLDYYLSRKAEYDAMKTARIERLWSATGLTDYERYSLLFDEYASHNYDSAHLYVDRLLDASELSGDKNKVALSGIRKGFIYLSAGLFKESSDLFANLDVAGCDTSVLLSYYSTYARLEYDLADYSRGEWYHRYITEGNRLTSESLRLMSQRDTSAWFYALAVRDMKEGNYVRCLERFRMQLLSSQITEHEKAITYSSMGYLCHAMGNQDESLHYNVLAAISDIKSSTKEAVALRGVALAVFERGMTDKALEYIRYALDDAQFYNARHRQLEISQILPIIEQSEQELLEAHSKREKTLSMVLYVLLLVLLVAFVVIYNRQRAATRARRLVETMNNRLREANRIKDEYISTFLFAQTDYVNQLEQYQRWVKKRAQEKRFEELQTVPIRFNATHARKEFYKQYDEMVLRIFPDFIESFNSLLREEERIYPQAGELLTPELRIFALIRLGVNKNEKIAQILDYSVNTIYTYKTRVRNKSRLSAEEFNAAVGKI